MPRPVEDALLRSIPPMTMAHQRSEPSLAAIVVREARPRQWLKNVLVFAAPAAAGVLVEWPSLWRAVWPSRAGARRPAAPSF
jgi:hypothetical protein